MALWSSRANRERDDWSLSDQQFIILQALRGNLRNGLYGTEIVEAVKNEYGETIPLGSLYVGLGRLVEKGFAERIAGKRTPGTKDLRRQFYRITRRGAEAMAAKRVAPVGKTVRGEI